MTWSDKDFSIGGRTFSHPSSGLAFIIPAPGSKTRMALIVDGNTPPAFKLATGLIPTKSSWTVPDWVVTGPEYGWNGAAGLLGAGYWSYNWNYEHSTSWMLPFDQM